MESFPTGFPLSPTDHFGNPLTVGSVVEIHSVASCIKELPEDDKKRLISLVGKMRTIEKFDQYGFVWLSFSKAQSASDFCLFPSEVAFITAQQIISNQ